MNKTKQLSKVQKYLVAAEECSSRDQAQDILSKYEKASAKLAAVSFYERLTN